METEHKIMSIRIIASAVLLGSSYIPSFTVEIHIALCIAAYLLIGADIVYKQSGICDMAGYSTRIFL